MQENLFKQGQRRLIGLIIFFLIALSGVIVRLYYLQIIKHEFYFNKVASQITRIINQPARRGNIYDRNGLLLATTIDTYSVYADTPQVIDKNDAAKNLAIILKLDHKDVLKILNSGKSFIWLKRKISDKEVEQLKYAQLKGVHLLAEQSRVFLHHNLASTVLGFVDIDNNGLSGIELNYDKLLQGIPGKLIVDKDVVDQEIYTGKRFFKEPVDGDSLELTIDEFLQYLSRKELKKVVDKYSADSGVVIMLDAQTGEVLAMVSYPDFDPNVFAKYPDYLRRNNAVQTVYEPGSVFKLITVASALDLNLVTSANTFVNGQSFEHGTRVIREAEALKNPFQPRQIKDIIKESLNIGAAKLGLKVGKTNLYRYAREFNFGRKTGIELAGESGGIVKKTEDWSVSDEAIVPFGQSIAATPLQMACAVNTIANDGVYIKPRVVKKIINANGEVLKDYSKVFVTRRVLAAKVAQEIRGMMKEAVASGTGISAQVYGYSIGGKTGTSQKADPVHGGYYPGQYISSFAGIISADKPRVTVLVVVNNPKGLYYGGAIAAPVFKNIAEETVRYLSIPPDL